MKFNKKPVKIPQNQNYMHEQICCNNVGGEQCTFRLAKKGNHKQRVTVIKTGSGKCMSNNFETDPRKVGTNMI